MRLNNGIMKVIILNGSPKAHGNTATALHEVERTLQQQGIARHGGATTTIDVLNKYFLKTNMPVVPSQYWSIAHGTAPGEVVRDEKTDRNTFYPIKPTTLPCHRTRYMTRSQASTYSLV